ncbi:MAG: DUF3781 domain-containing protein [Clostridium sp.]|nr:DUF3781 domain-containing protein [Clostridium sp.]
MENYKPEELTEALRAINSNIHKCEKAQEKFPEGNSQHTLLRNRLKAMYIAKALITDELSKLEPTIESQIIFDDNYSSELLLSNLDQLHTTNLGVERIRKNLRLDTDDVIGWCREKIKAANASITRKGKNWYITVDGCEITINAHSYTIITAHRRT